MQDIAAASEGFSGRDLRELVTQSFNLAFQRDMSDKNAAEIQVESNGLDGSLEQNVSATLHRALIDLIS